MFLSNLFQQFPIVSVFDQHNMTCLSPRYITTSTKLFQLPQFLNGLQFCQHPDNYLTISTVSYCISCTTRFYFTVSHCICDGLSQCFNLPQFLSYCVICLTIYFTLPQNVHDFFTSFHVLSQGLYYSQLI